MRMLRHIILATFLLVAMALGGCRANEIRSLSFGIGTMTDSPVYITELLLDNREFIYTPSVESSGVGSFPRTPGGTFFHSIVLPDSFTIKVTWLEIMSERAYEAQATVNASDLAVESGIGRLEVLFLPGGRMVIGSDPVPRSGKIVTRDIAEACGKRRPDLDRDIKGEVDSIAKLKEALQFATNPIDEPPCGEEK